MNDIIEAAANSNTKHNEILLISFQRVTRKILQYFSKSHFIRFLASCSSLRIRSPLIYRYHCSILSVTVPEHLFEFFDEGFPIRK